MLRGTTGILSLILVSAAVCGEPPLVPLTACEVVRDLPALEGKPAAVLGRYSFRQNGRWIGEQECTPAGTDQPQLFLMEDVAAPRPPESYELDGVAVDRKLAEVRRHTTLGKFRFGSPDYDRWAVVYGRIEGRKGEDAKKAPANLVFRGSGVVIFLTPQ
jgi:hypothetical protein